MSDLKKVKKMVMVDVSTTLAYEGQHGPLEIEEEALGSLYQVDPQTYILAYDSHIQEKKVTTTLKIVKNHISIVRIGDVHIRQEHSIGGAGTCQYFYGGNTVTLRCVTKELDYGLTHEGGIIELMYELWAGKVLVCRTRLELFIR